jgi:NAD(P)-dependent dehydrogenase (short-subunit alcohol dehydrogenase family)
MRQIANAILELEGRVAIVTGAGSGIGRSTAIRLASQGACIAAVDVDRALAVEVSDFIQSTGSDSIALTADIRREEDVRRAVESTVQRFGRVDILVNAAAAFIQQGVDATAAQWHEVLETNLIGTALCCRYASLEMRRQLRGSIINIGSTSGMAGQAGYATYNASKAALISLTQCLAVDLGAYGIRVNCVSPGATDTPALRKAVERIGMTFPDFERGLLAQQCIPRLCLPEEVASVVSFFASDQATALTGSNLVVDRGLMIKR